MVVNRTDECRLDTSHMKNFLSLLFSLAVISAFSQGVAVRSLNGFSTNQTHVGTATNFNLVETGGTVKTNYTDGSLTDWTVEYLKFTRTNALAIPIIWLDALGGVTRSPSFVGAFNGDGAGLSNVSAGASSALTNHDTRSIFFDGASLTLTNGAAGVSNVLSSAGWGAASGAQTNRGGFSVGIGDPTGHGSLSSPSFRWERSGFYIGNPTAVTQSGLVTVHQGVMTSRIMTNGIIVPDPSPFNTHRIGFSQNSDASSLPDAYISRTEAGTVTLNTNAVTRGLHTVTNGVLIRSNSWTAIPTLVPGDMLLASSNGSPHVIWKDRAGVLTTNLIGGAAAGDTLWATNEVDGSITNVNGGSTVIGLGGTNAGVIVGSGSNWQNSVFAAAEAGQGQGFVAGNGSFAGAKLNAATSGSYVFANRGAFAGANLDNATNSDAQSNDGSFAGAHLDGTTGSIVDASDSSVGVGSMISSSVALVNANRGSFAGGYMDSSFECSIYSANGSFAGANLMGSSGSTLSVQGGIGYLFAQAKTNISLTLDRSIIIGAPPNSYTTNFESTVAVIGADGAATGFDTNGFFGMNMNLSGTFTVDEIAAESLIATNIYTLLTNAAVLGTDANGKIISTNVTSDVGSSTTYVTNIYATNITAKTLTVNNYYALDGTITNGLYFVTNSWAGPTNTVDLRMQDQYYDTLVPLSITGFVNRSNTVSQSVTLTIRNLSATNITAFLPDDVRTSGFTNSFTVLAGSDYILSMKYSPSGPRTNAIGQSFF